ncbi:hypothetical protein HanIR_Chr14g0694271 [Helianthus annuus]|nr:hypothetical protein HanIR_Chr14g0694271 [Helianthus annuus]
MHMKCLLKCMNENLFPYISFFILFIVDYLEPKKSHMDNLARNTLSSMQIAGYVHHLCLHIFAVVLLTGVSSTQPVEVNSSSTCVCLTAYQTSFLVFGGFLQQKKPTAK